MVRIVSQNFSPQRSRHSSGETDKYLAERANLALGLSAFGKKRFDLPECESSSDSFWDSELDGDHHDAVYSEHGEDNNDINGNETLKKSNVQSKRKERRRERNKLSAQAYRQRRRSQNMKEQQQLLDLEEKNKKLHQIVDDLERQTEQTKQFLRGCSVPMPDILLPSSSKDTAACAGAASPDTLDLSQKCSRSVYRPDSTTHSTGPPNSPAYLDHSQPSPMMSNMNMPPHSSISKNDVSGASPSNAQGIAAVSPVPQTQILVNANALMKSQLQLSNATAVPTFAAVPTFMAIPVECKTAVTNLNLNSQTQSQKSQASSAAQNTAALEEKCSPTTSMGSPVMGAIMLSINGNPSPGAVYSLMNMEMCNNKNMNNVLKKNVNACDNSRHEAAPCAPGAPVTVNLNEVKVSGEPLHFWHSQRNYGHAAH